MATSTDHKLPDGLIEFADRFGDRLSQLIAEDGDAPATLIEAMRYSLLAPGKRLRPFLVVRCCELCGGGFDDAFAAAAAVEMVHAFSLIHDDLPAMDDDDLRRGRLTNHKKFGEAMAILAGDALLAMAFDVLGERAGGTERSGRLAAELARSVGWRGMIGGQAADILGESQPPSLESVQYIHVRKTAALFECSTRMGAISAGAAEETVDVLGRFGQKLGLAFQIADDLLDVSAQQADMGKAVGKDAKKGKQTYPECVGIEASRAAADTAVAQACESIEPFGERAECLRQLARFAIRRDR